MPLARNAVITMIIRIFLFIFLNLFFKNGKIKIGNKKDRIKHNVKQTVCAYFCLLDNTFGRIFYTAQKRLLAERGIKLDKRRGK